MLSQDSFDSVHSPEMVTEDEMEDEDDAMELLGTLIFYGWLQLAVTSQCKNISSG